MAEQGASLHARIVASLSHGEESASGKARRSILSQAATSFANKPSGAESTIPTGFDPRAASLFEAVVEAAYLVANADGEFDDTERATFESVVAEACANTVQPDELHDLISDLADQLEEDGIMARVKMVSQVVLDPDHRIEIMRIAALMAFISGGVDDSEREVMDALAENFGLSQADVDAALELARTSLS